MPENSEITTAMEIKNVVATTGVPGDDEEIVNEQEQNEIINEEGEGQTTNT